MLLSIATTKICYTFPPAVQEHPFFSNHLQHLLPVDFFDDGHNREVWLWSTKWRRAKASKVLPRECTGHSKYLLPTMWKQLYTGISLDGQYPNQNDYVLYSQKWRSSIQSAEIRLGANCGSDHELLIAKFRLKLEKLGKNTRSFRYNLNQITYDYTLEGTNRFKGLDPIDRVPEEVWMQVCNIVQDGN